MTKEVLKFESRVSECKAEISAIEKQVKSYIKNAFKDFQIVKDVEINEERVKIYFNNTIALSSLMIVNKASEKNKTNSLHYRPGLSRYDFRVNLAHPKGLKLFKFLEWFYPEFRKHRQSDLFQYLALQQCKVVELNEKIYYLVHGREKVSYMQMLREQSREIERKVENIHINDLFVKIHEDSDIPQFEVIKILRVTNKTILHFRSIINSDQDLESQLNVDDLPTVRRKHTIFIKYFDDDFKKISFDDLRHTIESYKIKD